MGYKRFCDATRAIEKAKDSFVEFGQVIKRQYAAEPAKDVQAFYDARDALHTRLCEEFREELDALKAQLVEKWPEIYLPDETDEVAEKRIASRIMAQEPKPKRRSRSRGDSS